MVKMTKGKRMALIPEDLIFTAKKKYPFAKSNYVALMKLNEEIQQVFWGSYDRKKRK